MNIVITGSSRGIGFHMAKSFLKMGHKVLISGSKEASTTRAMDLLSDQDKNKLFAHPCDVRSIDSVSQLADYGVQQMGSIDIWINNAGISQPQSPSYDLSNEVTSKVIDTNIHGVINGSKVAIKLFKKQQSGALYNMEGLGSDGRISTSLPVYGGTKSFVRYYSRCLEKEAKGQPYIVARTSPGMVTTELLLSDLDQLPDPEKSKRIYSILADKVTTVAPFLAKEIAANKKNGVLIAWLTTPKVIYRFMTAKFIKRDVF